MNDHKLSRAFGVNIHESPRTVLIGNEVSETPPFISPHDGGIIIKGTKGELVLTDDIISRGMLLLGNTGSGKTNLIMDLLYKVMCGMTDGDVVLIFDSKGDFTERFYSPENEKHMIISLCPEDREIAKSWNLFYECFDEGDDSIINAGTYDAVRELSKALFKNIESEQQPFFHIAASDVLRMVITSFLAYAEKTNDRSDLTNKALSDFLDRAVTEDLIRMAGSRFSYIRSYLGDPRSPTPQSLGVEGFIHAMASEIFCGNFREPSSAGDFSIKRIVNEKGGRVVFIKYDVAHALTLAPVYSLFYDIAIKEQLSCGRGRTYLFCDELSLLPNCSLLSAALNQGRSKGLRTIASLQSVNQLYDIYGNEGGRAIASGFVNLFAFRSDSDTRRFISERFGRTFEMLRYGGANIQHEGYTVNDSDIINLELGEAYADLFGEKPFKFRAEKFT